MDTQAALRYRLLLVGRALYVGFLWGVVFGEATMAVLGILGAIQDGGPIIPGLLLTILWSPVAGFVGGIVGGGISLASGLALAFSGNGVLRRTYRARLVTGSVAAAVPLAVAWELHQPGSSTDYLSAAGIATAAVVTAVLATPRILNGPPPPRNGTPMPPVLGPGTSLPKSGTPGPGTGAEDDERQEWQNTEPEPTFQRRLLIGRCLGWGIISGTALGASAWTVLCVVVGEVRTMIFVGFAAVVGAILGGCLGLADGLALVLSGSWAVERVYRAQLITGAVVTAIPLAAVYIAWQRGWTDGYLVGPVNLTVVAAITAVLLTPRIVTGRPAPRRRERTGGGAGSPMPPDERCVQRTEG